jgi:hypothetical protein
MSASRSSADERSTICEGLRKANTGSVADLARFSRTSVEVVMDIASDQVRHSPENRPDNGKLAFGI